VCLSPSALRIRPILHVLRIIEKFLAMPSELALFLTLRLRAVLVRLHLGTGNKELATSQISTIPCHETPPYHDWSIGCPLASLLCSGSIPVSTQTGGSILLSVKSFGKNSVDSGRRDRYYGGHSAFVRSCLDSTNPGGLS
jgi:hypothetical protein